MHANNRDGHPLDCPTTPCNDGSFPAHSPRREHPWNANHFGDLAEGHLATWDSAWIDLGGEG
jgi:hypothetical protein